MTVENLLLLCCGIEDDGQCVRLYLDGPNPEPSFDREQGVRTSLFHLFSGEEAAVIRQYLAIYRAWDVLRVPPAFSRERGIVALKIAVQWHSGSGSPLYLLASTRRIQTEKYRQQLRGEVDTLISSVLENPVQEGEYERLALLRDVVNTAPLEIELATAREVFE